MKKRAKNKFFKKKILLPKSIDEYLEFQYGNWKNQLEVQTKEST